MFATCVKDCGGAVFVLGTMLEALGVHWGDDFIFGIPDDRADVLVN